VKRGIDTKRKAACEVRLWRTEKGAENGALLNEVSVNQSLAHAELIAAFRRAQADAAHKFGLTKAVANKGPKAIQAAVDTAAKAAKRRDSYEKKLKALGVILDD
jgi:ATP-dependent protease HslVU (ClpYQ) peptidase subunit